MQPEMNLAGGSEVDGEIFLFFIQGGSLKTLKEEFFKPFSSILKVHG